MTRDQVELATRSRERREAYVRWRIAALLAVAVAVCDQIVKEIVRANMAMGDAVDLISGVLAIRRVRNEGIAFGLFPGNALVVGLMTVIALVVIGVALFQLVRRNTFAAVGGGMLLGGAAGNLFDRLIHGGVTDYIDFRWFPAFNVADIGITIGAAVLVIGLLFVGDDEPHTSASTSPR